MKFTRTEWEIIVHRLEEGDAIIEALTDHCDGELPACNHGKRELEDAIDTLRFNGCKRTWFSMVELTILRECCEGSTYFAGIEDRMPRIRVIAYQRAANRLENRFNVLIPRA